MIPLPESRDRGALFACAYLDSKLVNLEGNQQLHLFETVQEWATKADKSSLRSYFASFVGPVLNALDHITSELQGNVLSLYEDRSRKKVVALCYVVSPNQSLDQTVKGRNYAVSLIIALKRAGLKWGILTNGMLWRIYSVREKALFETYFQVHLSEVLRKRDSMEITLFANFFGASAFQSCEKGGCRLDEYRHESDMATREIEEHLENKIEDVLGRICMGFIESEGRKSYTEEEKRTIFSNSIYLLYRILFVLYAEARGFLPLQDPEYYSRSIGNLTSIAKENHSKGIADPHSRVMWNTLRELFDWINHGNRALGIPPYNGGLFDDAEKPYLANHAIQDAYLSEALFSLGFREEKDDVVRITYGDLSVRHLGGLYEGILEYQLFIAPERMVRRKEEKVYKFIPESHAGKITRADTVIEKGDIYFSQSSDERKLTGSYYTPEDIVRCIVENSLGQYLAVIEKEKEAFVSKLIEAHVTAVDDRERIRIERFIDSEIQSFLEKRVLSAKILDPAMGSGHFLINATHFITNYLVKSLYSTEWENDSVETSPLFWRRLVVERCIFGVDLNDLATELTKLSLWLITADKKKPLTFLDHHLRTGNSLLGADLNDLGTLPNNSKTLRPKEVQTTLGYPVFEKEFIPKVLQAFREMEISSEEIEDVERKKEKLKEWSRLKKDLQSVADTWLATSFGHQIAESEYCVLLNRAMEGKEIVINKKIQELASIPKNQFFHWWLEFPEVFFRHTDKDGEVGFDVIIGNPPWGSKMSSDINRLLAKKWSLSAKNVNTCALFVFESLKELKTTGFLGLLLPKVVIKNEAYYPVRKRILETCQMKQIMDFGQFPGVASDAIALIIRNEKDKQDTEISFFSGKELARKNEINQDLFLKNPSLRFSLSSSKEIQALLDKITQDSEQLNKIFKIKRGIELGQKSSIVKCEKCGKYNEAETKYYGSLEKKCKSCGTVLTISKENVIQISSLEKTSFYVQSCISGTQLQKYSIVGSYFIPANLKGIDYKEEAFTGNNILLKRISTRVEGTFIESKLLAFNTVYSLFNKDLGRDRFLYALGILNSKLMHFFYEHSYNIGMSLTTQVTIEFLSTLPIRTTSESTQGCLAKLVDRMLFLKKRLLEIARDGTCEKQNTEEEIGQVDAQIDEMVFRVYGLSDEEKRTIGKSFKPTSISSAA